MVTGETQFILYIIGLLDDQVAEIEAARSRV